MRRTRLVATALVSAVIGAVLALLAPAALAGTSDADGSPGNRGWVVSHSDSASSDSDGSDSDD
ncbi:hypothetical protein [Pseudonocardia zijingensis]|jgi:hypothetical protein